MMSLTPSSPCQTLLASRKMHWSIDVRKHVEQCPALQPLTITPMRLIPEPSDQNPKQMLSVFLKESVQSNKWSSTMWTCACDHWLHLLLLNKCHNVFVGAFFISKFSGPTKQCMDMKHCNIAAICGPFENVKRRTEANKCWWCLALKSLSFESCKTRFPTLKGHKVNQHTWWTTWIPMLAIVDVTHKPMSNELQHFLHFSKFSCSMVTTIKHVFFPVLLLNVIPFWGSTTKGTQEGKWNTK